MKKLKVSLTTHHSLNDFDNKLVDVFKDCLKYVAEKNPEFPFDTIELINFGYGDEPNMISENSITSLSPISYLDCKRKISDKLIPLGLIKKSNQINPYFPAFFISNKLSGIKSTNSPLIRNIYLVSKNSASGFIAPLYRLWEGGVIDQPNEEALKQKGWNVIIVGSHMEVQERINEDKFAIGATGQFDDSKHAGFNSRVISRYYYLPQDILVISENLQPYKKQITEWLNLHFNFLAGDEIYNVLSKSSKNITGFELFNEEYENSYDELGKMFNDVVSPTAKKHTLIPSEPDKLTLKQLLNLFTSLKTQDAWKLILVVVGMISTIALAAFKLGVFIESLPKK